MNENPTYEELQSANKQLMQKIEWLEGVYHSNRDAGMQVKSKFLSNISHEIRTPMNAIVGFSNLLKNTSLTKKERNEYLYYISHNSQTLLNVMDNIIDLTLLETNSLNIKQEEVFVEELFKEIFEYYNSKVVRTMNYRVALLMTTTSGSENGVTVKADGYRLNRILDNLVNTAIANQIKGVIEMKMEIVNENKVLFSIISLKNDLLEERAKMIFENNGNADDWHNHLDSTGLAYKLTRDLANAMGGAVNLVQVDKKRMAICIELPIDKIGKVNKDRLKKDVTALLN